MRSYYVYMLLCADRSFYIGVTNDAEKRVAEHQVGHDPRSYTFKRRPVKLVYCAEFGNVDEAIAWEKQIKGWSRAKKVAFISGNWELLHNLAKRTQREAAFDSLRSLRTPRVARPSTPPLRGSAQDDSPSR